MREKRVSVSVRLLPDVRYHLRALSLQLKTSQAALLESLITALYYESLHDWSGSDFADALITAKRKASGKTGASRLVLVAQELPNFPLKSGVGSVSARDYVYKSPRR